MSQETHPAQLQTMIDAWECALDVAGNAGAPTRSMPSAAGVRDLISATDYQILVTHGSRRSAPFSRATGSRPEDHSAAEGVEQALKAGAVVIQNGLMRLPGDQAASGLYHHGAVAGQEQGGEQRPITFECRVQFEIFGKDAL